MNVHLMDMLAVKCPAEPKFLRARGAMLMKS